MRYFLVHFDGTEVEVPRWYYYLIKFSLIYMALTAVVVTIVGIAAILNIL